MFSYLKHLTWSAFIIFFACEQNSLDQKEWNNAFPKYNSVASFSKFGDKTFVLDSVTALPYPIIQYVSNLNLVVGFTSYSNTFVFYDYNTGELKKKVPLSNNSENGVGQFSTSFGYSFYVINYDSIFLYNSDLGKIFLLDSSSTIKKTYSVVPIDKSFHQPSITHGELIRFADNNIFLSASPGRDVFNPHLPLSNNLVVKLDLVTGNVSAAVKYPENYQRAYWGDQMSIFYTAHDTKRNTFVYSFPIDHAVYSGQFGSPLTALYGGSDSVQHVLPSSFRQTKIDNTIELFEEQVNNFRSQRTYNRILYDKYSDVFYRFVTNAMGVDDKGSEVSSSFSIIILNKDLLKIGEVNFNNDQYLQCSMFVTQEGLCLLRMDSGDDQLHYDVYQLKLKM